MMQWRTKRTMMASNCPTPTLLPKRINVSPRTNSANCGRNANHAEPADPVEREAWRMAREKIEKQLTAENMWPAKGRDKFDRAVATRCEYLGRKMTTEEYIVAWLEKNPKVRTQAEKIVRSGREIDGRRRRDGVIETDAGARAPVFLWRQ
jgi:hypothetical protein